MAARRKHNDNDVKELLVRSARTGRFLKKEGFGDLGDVIDYAIKRTRHSSTR